MLAKVGSQCQIVGSRVQEAPSWWSRSTAKEVGEGNRTFQGASAAGLLPMKGAAEDSW